MNRQPRRGAKDGPPIALGDLARDDSGATLARRVQRMLRRLRNLGFLGILLIGSCESGTDTSGYADIRLATDFEGGSLGWHAQVSPGLFYISVRHDTNGPHLRWYSFRIMGSVRDELTFRITNANETSSAAAWAFDRPVVSIDGGETWERIADTEFEGRFFTFRYAPRSGSDWIAYAPVYGFARWTSLVEEIRGHSRIDTLEVVAQSIQGRPIHLLKVTDNSVPDGEKTAVWAVARQHAGDAGASWMAEGLLRWLLGSDPAAIELTRRCVVYLAPLMNPDGVVLGNHVANSAGVNLNRVWHQPDPATAPSVVAFAERMREYVSAGGSIALFVDFQTQALARKNFVYYNGPDDTSPGMAAEIQEFIKVLNRVNPDITADSSEVWEGETAVASRWAYDTFGTHGIMLEGSFQDVLYGPYNGEYMTVERYLALGEAFGRAVAEFFYGVGAGGQNPPAAREAQNGAAPERFTPVLPAGPPS